MPIMDGWECTLSLRMLMEHQSIPKIHIIGLTAFTSSKDLQKCFLAGMSDVLHKPLEISKLLDVFKRFKCG